MEQDRADEHTVQVNRRAGIELGRGHVERQIVEDNETRPGKRKARRGLRVHADATRERAEELVDDGVQRRYLLSGTKKPPEGGDQGFQGGYWVK